MWIAHRTVGFAEIAVHRHHRSAGNCSVYISWVWDEVKAISPTTCWCGIKWGTISTNCMCDFSFEKIQSYLCFKNINQHVKSRRPFCVQKLLCCQIGLLVGSVSIWTSWFLNMIPIIEMIKWSYPCNWNPDTAKTASLHSNSTLFIVLCTVVDCLYNIFLLVSDRFFWAETHITTGKYCVLKCKACGMIYSTAKPVI